MSVYVDALFNGAVFERDAATIAVGRRNAHQWCHLAAETPAELHAFAARLGLKEDWFQGDHYDLTPKRRAKAVALGAIEVTGRDLVRAIRRFRIAQSSPRSTP